MIKIRLVSGAAHVRIQMGAGGPDSPPPLKNHKKGFFSNTGPSLIKNHKATKPAFSVGPSSPPSEPPFKWRFAGGPMMARF